MPGLGFVESLTFAPLCKARDPIVQVSPERTVLAVLAVLAPRETVGDLGDGATCARKIAGYF